MGIFKWELQEVSSYFYYFILKIPTVFRKVFSYSFFSLDERNILLSSKFIFNPLEANFL